VSDQLAVGQAAGGGSVLQGEVHRFDSGSGWLGW
jgi:hypothetical protein